MKELLLLITLMLIIITFLIVINGGLVINKFMSKIYKRKMVKTPW